MLESATQTRICLCCQPSYRLSHISTRENRLDLFVWPQTGIIRDSGTQISAQYSKVFSQKKKEKIKTVPWKIADVPLHISCRFGDVLWCLRNLRLQYTLDSPGRASWNRFLHSPLEIQIQVGWWDSSICVSVRLLSSASASGLRSHTGISSDPKILLLLKSRTLQSRWIMCSAQPLSRNGSHNAPKPYNKACLFFWFTSQ